MDEEDNGKCPLNGDPGACGFGTFVGVVAFIICIVFLVMFFTLFLLCTLVQSLLIANKTIYYHYYL